MGSKGKFYECGLAEVRVWKGDWMLVDPENLANPSLLRRQTLGTRLRNLELELFHDSSQACKS